MVTDLTGDRSDPQHQCSDCSVRPTLLGPGLLHPSLPRSKALLPVLILPNF